MPARFRSLPIFWQTLALLLGGLVVSQIVAILLIMYLPAPRPDFYTMSEIAEALASEDATPSPLAAQRRATAPGPQPGMIATPGLSQRLAGMVHRPLGEVRLFFQADQSESFPWGRRTGRGAVPIHHGQPYFFNTVEAALALPEGGWRVVRTPPPPLISSWQKRTIICFGFSALAMLPFAFLFARALTRPIRRLAAAVERIDHDAAAPPVPAEGPSELRLTAHALNTLRTNLHAYLRERTAMIGAIAHDLRSPLARIAFRIERAPQAIRVPVQHDIEQMQAMIATTIGFVRDGAGVGERRPVELSALARRLAQQARETGSEVRLGSVVAATVEGDRGALERLVQNLIDNAVKYAGGAELTIERAEDRARLCVTDRGPGIAEEALERMFEPFARADPSRSRSTGGIGLGLAIARSIAAAHGGSITAANRHAGGLAMTVELPLAD
ncbi:sensor histidine kinase [Sphingomonas morindae]|uniref:histidine kinase n=1 Tax=Sphingomonas morindae TaxID=1541170 RepID=A0ABY4XB49_9SPHN|nr:HAMP domain-containing sensor histidine kinase [Sphingomonas morindae]USI74187.1 HAMP domain-containing histidine kinase [Sphingomonas morindae]